MKKISEMSLEELQDYALKLEGEKQTLTDQVAEKQTTIDDLNATNLALQQRNNRLFMQVEQGTKDPAPTEEDPEDIESCEDFASRTVKEIFS